MNPFNRSQVAVLNIPSTEIIPYLPTLKVKHEDRTECYTIPVRSIIGIGHDKQAYLLEDLVRLLDIDTVMRRYGLFQYHTGKETVLAGGKPRNPHIAIDDENGKLTLWPNFYRCLSSKTPEALLKITAPSTWHEARNAAKPRVDPEITVLWKPEYA